MATMLVAVVVSIAGGDQGDQEASRQKPGKNCFQRSISIFQRSISIFEVYCGEGTLTA